MKYSKKLLKDLDKIKNRQQWDKSANIQEERGWLIKRWKRGQELLLTTGSQEWLKQAYTASITLQELEEEVNMRIDTLIDKRDNLNEKKIRIRKKQKNMKKSKRTRE